ncbi:MAG: alanine--tRNA ligase [Deltaproteobacteria bacterium]|nr:alanine--tRNA ligase [Deltaproteobacteria bacterium]MBW2331237.1 alanine--tRNA ligase [Deltaproteobacteria bacterium]
MTGDDLRNKFLAYFEQRGHTIVKSSSLVPDDDPTLLFTNAGMVQFKRTFLGEDKRPYVRAASSQKCVRAGGKHNDLENVGHTGRHHTFFEMMGNFSFGDYFKERAIELGWDLVTRGYGIPEDRLWVSVYEKDDEAHRLWSSHTGIPEDRIVRLGEKDNFWSMGDTGPCGPCSEILIDQGEAVGCGRPECRVGCECDRYLELWNLVFMEFNRDEAGRMTPLPKPSIDTGMGLERIAAVVHGVTNNYETDLFMPIIKEIGALSGHSLGESPRIDVSIKVIADHSRAAAFLIGDGVLPSNEGRGYVLRRILRRAIRYGRTLGLARPFLHQIAGKVSQVMKMAYPELLEADAYIKNIIKNEEVRFLGTLDTGLRVLEDALGELKTRGVSEVPGDLIFKMYDTYGFPVDIIQDIVREDRISLDMTGFEQAMAQQRLRSRTAWKGAGDQWAVEAYKVLSGQGIETDFVGYDFTSIDSEVLMVVIDGKALERASAGDSIELVTAKTPFYGEAGGQVGDRGLISGQDFEMEVSDTVKDPNNIIIHKGKVLQGSISPKQTVTLTVDQGRRLAIARNHTATHILHAVLRQLLGDHVKQSGSLVTPDRLRFDFTHFFAVEEKRLQEIETLVNERIQQNIPLQIEEMDAEDAFKTGATALFEEKYGDRVRLVAIEDFSKELCGGTHTERTGDIGLFKIVSEGSVAAGVRRIEALTGKAALSYTQETTQTLHTLAQMLKSKPEELTERFHKTLTQLKGLDRELAALKAKAAAEASGRLLSEVRTVNGVSVLAQEVSVDTPAALREMADHLKAKMKSGILVLGSKAPDKVLLVAVVTKEHLGRYHAGQIVKQVAAVVGGGGGGRPDMAQAGGSKPEKLPEALARVFDIVAQG